MPVLEIKDALNYAKQQAQKSINPALKEDVTDEVRQVEQEHIQSDVFDHTFPLLMNATIRAD